MPTVFVVGSSNLDYSVVVEHLPDPGATVPGAGFTQSVGGKGANQAVAAYRAGADVVFVTKVGMDPQGDLITSHLRESGLSPTWLLRDPIRESGVALILVERTGRNQIVVAPGSNHALTPQEVQRALSVMTGDDLLLIQLEISLSTVRAALEAAKGRGARTVLNPAPAQPFAQDLLAMVDVLVPNETETTALTGCTDMEEAGRLLVGQGPKTVIVTLGDRGALLCQATGCRWIAPYPVQAVDSTAAGDAFCGALACGLAEGWSLDRTIRFANAAGALTTTKRGALESLPLRAEMIRLQEEAGG